MGKEEKAIVDVYCTYLSTCYLYCPRLVAGIVNVFLLHIKTEFILYHISDHTPVTWSVMLSCIYGRVVGFSNPISIYKSIVSERRKRAAANSPNTTCKECIRGELAWLISCYKTTRFDCLRHPTLRWQIYSRTKWGLFEIRCGTDRLSREIE
jgi:hypothetical protein